MEMHVRYELVIAVYGCKHSVPVLDSILCVVAANIIAWCDIRARGHAWDVLSG